MSADRAPVVDVVVPVYNARDFVVEAVRSVLSQSVEALSVIVVDDGSTDGSGDAVAGIDDARITVVRQANAGVSRARNAGAALASAPFLAFLDADDFWVPNALSLRLEALEHNRHWHAVGGLMHHVDRTGRVLGISGEVLSEADVRHVADAALMPFPLSSLLLRRDAFEAAGGFDEELGQVIPGQVEDLDLLSRIAQSHPLGVVPEVVGGYRMHGASASARHFRSQREGARFLRARARARRAGADLTWEAFHRSRRPSPVTWLSDTSALLYRRAGLAVAERAWAQAAVNATGAVLLGPRYALPRLVHQRAGALLTRRRLDH